MSPFSAIELLPTGLTSSFKYSAVGPDDPLEPPQAASAGLTEDSRDKIRAASNEPTNSHLQDLTGDFESIFSLTPYVFTYTTKHNRRAQSNYRLP